MTYIIVCKTEDQEKNREKVDRDDSELSRDGGGEREREGGGREAGRERDRRRCEQKRERK